MCRTTGPYAAHMPKARGRKKLKGRDNGGRRGESVHATKVEGNGEGSQQEGGRTDGSHAPVPPPYCTPDDIVIRALHITQCDELMDRLMGDKGL